MVAKSIFLSIIIIMILSLIACGGNTPVEDKQEEVAVDTEEVMATEEEVRDQEEVAVDTEEVIETEEEMLTPSDRILFTSDRDGYSEIYVMDSDGSDQTRLTNNSAIDSHPTWSPDGSRIAFQSTMCDGTYFQICVMDADGSNQICLTDIKESTQPSWSPDGSRIAFRSVRDGNNEIYVMDADGSNQVRLTDNPAKDWKPVWSPDGSRIAFWSERDGGNVELYIMDSDGSNQTRLSTDDVVTRESVTGWYTIWSPDHTRRVFESNKDGDYEIYVVNADGSNEIRLTDNSANDVPYDW